MPPDEVTVEIETIPLLTALDLGRSPKFDALKTPAVREAKLLTEAPWVRAPAPLAMTVKTECWKFPVPPGDAPPPPGPTEAKPVPGGLLAEAVKLVKPKLRPLPCADTVVFKDRLLYLLQPPIEQMFVGKQVSVPFPPYPYQLEGIAFLMPRRCALLADEMGLGKTVQTILAIRLLLQAGIIKRVLLVCPKPLVFNWCRELRSWAADLPYEVIGGGTSARKAAWAVSSAPLKIVNYEVLTRDAQLVENDETIRFDLMVLDEAQRVKNRDSKTAQAARAVRRERSWALTGTPIENKPEDLVNLFAYLDPGRVPPETPAKMLPELTADSILRRTKDDVMTDLPAKTVIDAVLELSPAQRTAYDRAETEGVVHLNDMGSTITIQHVFDLVMRLKQICNFDPGTGDSCKLERLVADMAEVAESGRKAIVFSQWVQPLERIAEALAPYGPLMYHGKIPQRERTPILDQFKEDPTKHVILMSYGTGSVGLNLQFTNYVFLFDRWWNPAIEDQAINRAHRIGQKEPVFVTRFVTQNTIENRIAEVLDRKRQLFEELIAQNGPPPRLGMSEDEVFGLFRIPSRPRRAAA